MESWRVKGLVCFVVVLVAAAGVFGAQHLGDPASSVLLSNGSGLFETGTLQTTSSADWQLENIGRQITDPAQAPSPFQETHTRNATVLPAVPAAISMTLCGFLCVSFVRDRRGWLAMAAGIIWFGQVSIHAVPELTHRICSCITTSKSSPIGLNRPQVFFSSDSTTGNAQSISFMGLLRKLEGIPDHNLGVLSINSQSIQAAAGNCENTGRQLIFVRKHSTLSLDIALGDCRHNILSVCPVTASGHFIVFSPAFVFQNLSRGPPAIKIRAFQMEGSKSGFAKRSFNVASSYWRIT